MAAFLLNKCAAPPSTQLDPALFNRNLMPTPSVPGSTSRDHPLGSFDFDRLGDYTLLWSSMDVFHAWLRKEQSQNTVELRRREIRKCKEEGGVWREKHYYVCARNGTGGKKNYEKKTEKTNKVPSKRLEGGCPLRLTIKTYPGTSTVLGLYKSNHSHALGNENVPFTRLPEEDKEEMAKLLRLGVEPKNVLKQMRNGTDTEEHVLNPSSSQRPALRREFITASNVRRVQRKVEQESIRLADSDGGSVELHVQQLRENGANVFLKRSCDPPPPGSGLAEGAFVLIIQTPYQKRRFAEWGNGFAGIDATHNTTHYEGLSLFTLMLRDPWGRGFPAATMSSSNGTDATINFFLANLRTWFPHVIPKRFMTDRDQAQINAIRRQYSLSRIFLCWWHVLHAWQQHFNASEFPELWRLLKSWIRITDPIEFTRHWEQIKAIAPASIVEYLTRNWMAQDVVEMWSAVYRLGFSIEEESDTNMLTEAWHHLLKGHFLDGKCNRRLDHLIYVITRVALPHFIVRHRRQELGFEGLNLREERRAEVEMKGAMILKAEIIADPQNRDIYTVYSQTNPTERYVVDTVVSKCSCPAFPAIQYCKHLHAVVLQFTPPTINGEDNSFIPITSLSSSSATRELLSSIDPQLQLSDSATNPTDDDLAREIQYKLNTLTAQLQLESLTDTHGSSLEQFSAAIDDFTTALGPSDMGILPAKRKIAPNQHSWTETAAVMGVAVKGAKKRKHTDPYSKGERSGQLAKPDAKHASTSSSVPTNTATSSANNNNPNPIPYAQSFICAQVDLKDTGYLETLKRQELWELCGYYKVSASRSNEETIRRLQASVLPPSTPSTSQSTLIPSSTGVFVPPSVPTFNPLVPLFPTAPPGPATALSDFNAPPIRSP